MFLIVVEDAVTMTTATLQDSTEKNSGSSEPKLIILYPVSGGGGGGNDLFTLRIIIENHFSVVFIISKETFNQTLHP